MLAEIGPFQALLDAIGWLLAWLYDLTGSFGFAIIILPIVFRIVLLPLGIKQIKSMQAMQALQPKIKEIQEAVTIPVKVKTHGRWRLNHCEFPPLSIAFPAAQTAGTPFEGLPGARLTSFCRNHPAFEQYILQELQL